MNSSVELAARVESEIRRKVVSDQANIPTSLDNIVLSLCAQARTTDLSAPAVALLTTVDGHRGRPRFVTFADRIAERHIRGVWELTGAQQACQQGMYCPIQWRGLNLFKSATDLAIYAMLLSELRPQTILEVGSTAGSVTWFLDMITVFSLTTEIVSIDLNIVNVADRRLRTVFGDCTEEDGPFANVDLASCGHPWLVLEDAHVGVINTLAAADRYVECGDYLVVEDSSSKQNAIGEFLGRAQHRYLVDTRYADYFGRNSCSSADSIFRIG